MKKAKLNPALKFCALYIFNFSFFGRLILKGKLFVIFFNRTVTKQVSAAFI